MRRWLLAQTGPPWDAVHGELRARINPSNAVQLHIWEHAKHYVAQRVELVDGKPYHLVDTGWGYWAGTPVGARQSSVYVCPNTGILRPTPVMPRKRKCS